MSKHFYSSVAHDIHNILRDIENMSDDDIKRFYGIEINEDKTVYDPTYDMTFSGLVEWAEFSVEQDNMNFEKNYYGYDFDDDYWFYLGNKTMKIEEILKENLDNDEIHYVITYEIVKPEDVEFGEASDRGFISEDEVSSYDEMVHILYGTEPSSYPPSPDDWYTHNEYNIDYETGAIENRSYHGLTQKDKELMLKAWKEANGKTDWNNIRRRKQK